MGGLREGRGGGLKQGGGDGRRTWRGGEERVDSEKEGRWRGEGREREGRGEEGSVMWGKKEEGGIASVFKLADVVKK